MGIFIILLQEISNQTNNDKSPSKNTVISGSSLISSKILLLNLIVLVFHLSLILLIQLFFKVLGSNLLTSNL